MQDVAQAIISAAEKPLPGEAINIGSGTAVSVIEIAEMLSSEMKKDISSRILGKYRNGDIRHCFADISKARRLVRLDPFQDVPRRDSGAGGMGAIAAGCTRRR